jgi:hypothetical protein
MGLFSLMGKQPLGGLMMILFVQRWIGGLLRNVTMEHAAGVVLLCSIWFVNFSLLLLFLNIYVDNCCWVVMSFSG